MPRHRNPSRWAPVEKITMCLGGCYLRWGAFDPGASGGLAKLPRTKETRKLESGRLVQSLHD